MAVVTLATLSAAVETSKFFVECHSFVAAEGDIPKDYAYHLKAFGYLEEVANGIDINLDEANIVLSVDSRVSDQEYSALYPKLALVRHSQQRCENKKCKQVEYAPQDFEGTLVVTYDKDQGVMFIKHVLTPETLVQARGGCLFVPVSFIN